MDKVNKVLEKIIEDRGYTINNSMSGIIQLWKSWYKGNVEGFHNYSVWNGIDDIKQKRASMQIAKNVCEQLANLLFNEKCGIAINDTATGQYIKGIFDINDIYVKLNESQEKKSAFGTMAYIPYWTDEGIKMNYITAENMVPLSWENGTINELCVYSTVMIEGTEYLFVQLFYVDKSTQYYLIENVLIDMGEDDNDTYEELILNNMPGFEDVEEIVHTNSIIKPFIIDKLNLVNNIDLDNPLGIAVFANAIDTMRLIDTIFDSYQNEFVLGKKRIMVSSEAINVMSGRPVFNPNDMIFYQLPQGVQENDRPFIKELDMDLRTTDHEKALQQALNIFSSLNGLGETFYRFGGGTLATATQVVSENNTMFRTLKKHEIILEAVIVDLIRLLIDIGQRHGIGGLNSDVEITVKFDDSIIEDKNAEIQRRMAQVSARLIRPEVFLSWYYGITEEDALKLMPGMPVESQVQEGIV